MSDARPQGAGNVRDIARERNLRNKRKKQKRKLGCLYFLIVMLVLVAGVVLCIALFFNIETVKVTGQNSLYSAQEIAEKSGIEAGTNMVALDTKSAEDAILSSFIYIDSVKVRRSLPKTVRIEVTMAKISGIVTCGKGYAYLSSGGRLLGLADKPDFSEYPLLYGLDASDMEPGESFKSSEFKAYSDVLSAAEDTGIKNLTLIDARDDLEVTVLADSRLCVEFGVNAELADKMRITDKIINEKLGADEKGIIIARSAAEVRFIPSDKSSYTPQSYIKNKGFRDLRNVSMEKKISSASGSLSSAALSQ